MRTLEVFWIHQIVLCQERLSVSARLGQCQTGWVTLVESLPMDP